MTKYLWAPTKKRTVLKISDSIKSEIKRNADELIDQVLKPKYTLPPP